MEVDFLIVGGGISGTLLSYYLQKENSSFVVIDNNFKNAASKVAAGIINPVTGRRVVTVWKVNELHPFAKQAYEELGDFLQIKAISQKNIIDFFPSPFMRESYIKKIEQDDSFVSLCQNENSFAPFFNYDFGCAQISGSYVVHLEHLLPSWRNWLKKNSLLQEEEFQHDHLRIDNEKLYYKNIIANKIIFCDGVAGGNNPFFKLLPFAPNKGEALIVDIPNLPKTNIYKKSMSLVPLVDENLFWIGSTYLWDFADEEPTIEFKETTTTLMSQWLKIPFKIIDHLVGLRPATVERRPFIGMHPHNKKVGILNGMGTKGCSIAPYFAKQLCNHLLYETAIDAEADVSRYEKILSRNNV